MTSEYIKVDFAHDASGNEDGCKMHTTSPINETSQEDKHENPSEGKTTEVSLAINTTESAYGADTESLNGSEGISANVDGVTGIDRPDCPTFGRSASDGQLPRPSPTGGIEPAEIGLDDYQLTFFQDLSNDNDDLCPPALIPRGFLERCIRSMVKEILEEKVEEPTPQRTGRPRKNRRRRHRNR